jgi:hypothetical protein
MPSTALVIRLRRGKSTVSLAATLLASGEAAAKRFEDERGRAGVRVLLGGEPAYLVELVDPAPGAVGLVEEARGRLIAAVFAGRSAVRRKLTAVDGTGVAAAPAAVDLTAGRSGAAPLFLLGDGSFSQSGAGPGPRGLEASPALVAAARWITTRRTSTFERLFPPDPFHPEQAARTERLSAAQGRGLLEQLDSALAAAAVTGDPARRDPEGCAQLRSAALTVLSHLSATALSDATPAFRALADEAIARIFALVESEKGEAARPALRAHAVLLLQLRGPALQPADRSRAKTLLGTLLRKAPPYDDPAENLAKGPWRFAMCSDADFHEGECEVLMKKHHFQEVPAPDGAPKAPARSSYRFFQAPFHNPSGQAIFVCARDAEIYNENKEMGDAWFHGALINRHAQLGSFDLRATMTEVKQQGYKLMMNSQCAGLTTRFTISRMFPDADIYSSWDSTYFRTEGPGDSGKVTASEGLDCFVAVLKGMAARDSHEQISARIRAAQWPHDVLSWVPGFVQFVGPSHPELVARMSDVNHDGRADLYDGFLDFQLKAIAEDIRASATPRDPGVAATQIGGAAAAGLDWAAGSLDRVAQYSDLWAGLPGDTERLYAFSAGGFYSGKEPPLDVPVAASPVETLGLLPSVVRWRRTPGADPQAEVMLHAWLSHSGREYKRLLCAAEAMWRAFDLGILPRTGPLSTPAGQRGAVLLCMAGLLEFPADQNYLDALWSAALAQLNLPEISRSVVRACITEADHDASNYYGSVRSLDQLLGDGSPARTGDLGRADAVAWQTLHSADPRVGRARPLALP